MPVSFLSPEIILVEFKQNLGNLYSDCEILWNIQATLRVCVCGCMYTRVHV